MAKAKAKTKAPKQNELLPSEMLRGVIQELLDNGVTMYRVAMDAGVAWQTLQRFMRRERSLSVPSFDQLSQSLGLHLVRGKRPARPSSFAI